MTFGDWLRRELKARGLTMTECARLVGVSQAAVSNWVRGQRRPDAESIGKLAEVLGLPISVVLNAAVPSDSPDKDDQYSASGASPSLELLTSWKPGWPSPAALPVRRSGTWFESDHTEFRAGFALGRESALEEIRRTLRLVKTLPMDEQAAMHVRPLVDSILAAFEQGEATIDKKKQEE